MRSGLYWFVTTTRGKTWDSHKCRNCCFTHSYHQGVKIKISFRNCSKNGVQGLMKSTKAWCNSWGLWQGWLFFCIWLSISKIEFIPKTDSLTWKNGRRIQAASTVQLLNWQEQRTGEKWASPPASLVPQNSCKPNMGPSPNIFSEHE